MANDDYLLMRSPIAAVPFRECECESCLHRDFQVGLGYALKQAEADHRESVGLDD
jgi:hypothetical protein